MWVVVAAVVPGYDEVGRGCGGSAETELELPARLSRVEQADGRERDRWAGSNYPGVFSNRCVPSTNAGPKSVSGVRMALRFSAYS